MATISYAPKIDTAQRLINKYGRAVTLIAFDTTPSDASRPWKGPTDPRGTPDATLAVDAVFVEPTGLRQLGLNVEVSDFVKRSEQIMIISPGATIDLKDYQEVIDTDGTRWKIVGHTELAPGPDLVLAYVGVRR